MLFSNQKLLLGEIVMKITSANPKSQLISRPFPQLSAGGKDPGSDSVTLGSSSDFKGGVTGGVLGIVPGLGAVTLGVGGGAAAIAAGFGVKEAETITAVATLGSLANVAGTLTLVGGALTGNQTALNISYGLLGTSGLAGIYVGAKL